MESKHKVYNLIILDESGSMESIRKTIINGFNEVVQTIKGIAIEFPEQEHYVTMITFNSLGIKTGRGGRAPHTSFCIPLCRVSQRVARIFPHLAALPHTPD